MTEKSHFENNLFYLSLMIKMLNSGNQASADSEYFSSQILSNLFFINETLQKMFDTLYDNNHLIKRMNLLHEVLKLSNHYIDLIETFCSDAHQMNDEYENYVPQFQNLIQKNLNNINKIQNVLKEAQIIHHEKEVISSDEMSQLLAPHPD